MKILGKFLFRALIFVAVLIAGLGAFGPREPAVLEVVFDDSLLEGGVDGYLAAQEARFNDIIPGVQKRVIWADAPEKKTEWSVVYVHGFSATSEEIRPVPDRVAKALDANLIFTRLRGHGRPGGAMGEARVADWMADVAEALAIAHQIGDRVLVISTSTGGTLMAAAALDKEMTRRVQGIVMVSPNFGVNSPFEPLLTMPAARSWLPLLAGAERSWEPHNEAQGKFWTTTYPSVAVMPMAALVKEVNARDLSRISIPALFLYAERDTVVRAEKTKEAARAWGAPTKTVLFYPGEGDDPSRHVIAGDILSPVATPRAVEHILDWAETL
ncbi:MAG: alpha/beta fold hydrolase [Pseudomonadota bacterium]